MAVLCGSLQEERDGNILSWYLNCTLNGYTTELSVVKGKFLPANNLPNVNYMSFYHYEHESKESRSPMVCNQLFLDILCLAPAVCQVWGIPLKSRLHPRFPAFLNFRTQYKADKHPHSKHFLAVTLTDCFVRRELYFHIGRLCFRWRWAWTRLLDLFRLNVCTSATNATVFREWQIMSIISTFVGLY